MAQQGDFIDGQSPVLLAIDVCRDHAEGNETCPLGIVDTLDEAVEAVIVHQEANRAAVHPVNRLIVIEAAAKRIQHGTVATHGNDYIGF